MQGYSYILQETSDSKFICVVFGKPFQSEEDETVYGYVFWRDVNKMDSPEF